jgi:hypothetical protein
MKKLYFISICFVTFFFSISLISCGGSGGGSDGNGGGAVGATPISYTGLTAQASISATNAADMTTGAVLGASVGAAVVASTDSENSAKPVVSHFYVIDLPDLFRRSAESVNWQHAITIAATRTESDTIAGECGGNLNYTITVEDITGVFTGIFTYSQFCESGITIDGTVDIDGSIDLVTNEFLIINFNFDNISSDEFVISGIISLNDTDAISSIITMDFLFKDIASNKVYWVNDYSLTITDINAADTEVTITGVFYDPDYGFVDVSTAIPFIFISADEWPSTGIMLCEGNGNTKAMLNAIDNQSYRVEADTNGDNVNDYDSGVLLWADL